MDKVIRAKAARWAKRHIDKPTTPTVRNWTHEDAANHLAQAYLAGARRMDEWHRNRNSYLRSAVCVSDIVDIKIGPLSTAQANTLERDNALVGGPWPKCPECGTQATERRPNVYFCLAASCKTLTFTPDDTVESRI